MKTWKVQERMKSKLEKSNRELSVSKLGVRLDKSSSEVEL